MESSNMAGEFAINPLKLLSRDLLGDGEIYIVPLAAGGSSRQYYRLTSGNKSVVGVVGKDIDENKSFIYLSQHFYSLGFPVARVLAISADVSCYIVEDLGDTSLFDCLVNEQVIEKAVTWLPTLQLVGAERLDFSKCYPVESMDLRSVMWDLNYFKYCFLKPVGVEFNEALLESEFERFSARLLDRTDGAIWGFMYRDFQSRNVMVVDDNPYFIDFQGGRRGPVQYDLVSFLWQARAGFSPDFRFRMIEAYMDKLAEYVRFDRKDFVQSLKLFVLFRLMQVLGAYGFRGLVQNKTHFVVSIVPAVKSLAYELENGVADEYPYLKSLLLRVTESDLFSPKMNDRLTVRVNSFGFRKSGIPRDMSGNGGGFVFDCRALPNPGRLDEYKPLTGRDKAVCDYLEQYDEVEEFFSHASAMAVNAVKRYVERGFTDLSISFGCTGGRHRSVYMAERLASLLSASNDVKVILTHVEQNIQEEK